MTHHARGYHYAVDWVARNDEPLADKEETSNMISVLLVADIYGHHPCVVASDVIAAREGYKSKKQ